MSGTWEHFLVSFYFLKRLLNNLWAQGRCDEKDIVYRSILENIFLGKNLSLFVPVTKTIFSLMLSNDFFTQFKSSSKIHKTL